MPNSLMRNKDLSQSEDICCKVCTYDNGSLWVWEETKHQSSLTYNFITTSCFNSLFVDKVSTLKALLSLKLFESWKISCEYVPKLLGLWLEFMMWIHILNKWHFGRLGMTIPQSWLRSSNVCTCNYLYSYHV